MQASRALLALALASACSAPPSAASDLRSPDPQTRCDAFYELFLPTPEGDEHTVLNGRSTAEVHELLGDPTSTGTLHAAGAEWLQVQYLFEQLPSKAPSGRDAWEQGWRYGPSIVFRDGVVVPFDQMARETGLLVYPVAPEHLRFQPGGSFP